MINRSGPLALACNHLWQALRDLPAAQRVHVLDAWCRALAA